MKCVISVWKWLRDYTSRTPGALVIYWTMWNRCQYIRWPHFGYRTHQGTDYHYAPTDYEYRTLPPLFPGKKRKWRWHEGDYYQMSRLLQAGARQYP